jgi:hypothetical protein
MVGIFIVFNSIEIDYRPTGTGSFNVPTLDDKKPVGKRPIVPVLSFPTELASPQSLFYQPTIEDGLGNRGPPEAVIPAGIVQSGQPSLDLVPFSNSKESAWLQSIRDESEKNKEENGGTMGVEVL